MANRGRHSTGTEYGALAEEFQNALIGKRMRKCDDDWATLMDRSLSLYTLLFNKGLTGNGQLDMLKKALNHWPFSRLDKSIVSNIVDKTELKERDRYNFIVNVDIFGNLSKFTDIWSSLEAILPKFPFITSPEKLLEHILVERVLSVSQNGLTKGDPFQIFCMFLNTSTTQPALEVAELLVPLISGMEFNVAQKEILVDLCLSSLRTGWFEAANIILKVCDWKELNLLSYEDYSSGNYLIGIRWGMPLEWVERIVEFVSVEKLKLEYAPYTTDYNPLHYISEKTRLDVIEYLTSLFPEWLCIHDSIQLEEALKEAKTVKDSILKEAKTFKKSETCEHESQLPLKDKLLNCLISFWNIFKRRPTLEIKDQQPIVSNLGSAKLKLVSPPRVCPLDRSLMHGKLQVSILRPIYEHDNLLAAALYGPYPPYILHEIIRRSSPRTDIYSKLYYEGGGDTKKTGLTLLMLAIQQLSKYPCNTSSGSYDCLTEYMEILEHILKETPLNIIRYQGLNANGSVNCALFRFGALSTIPKACSNVLREVFQKQGQNLSIRYLKNQCEFNRHVLTNPMVLRLILSEGYDWTDFVNL
eukprot:TRINITY_DN77_c0_g1_i1.p1 TRINITY_DN77_c0_g1~~TRINITY_DN77_c0_g1_i1.p1  ORF type:complete len:584 (+),score=73.74 TRINITY_DN77_c0_g1_i1:121-1872(+)